MTVLHSHIYYYTIISAVLQEFFGHFALKKLIFLRQFYDFWLFPALRSFAGNAEQRHGISSRNIRGASFLKSEHAVYRGGGVCGICRIIQSAAEWLWGKIRAVGLHKQALARDLFDDRTHMPCVFECHGTGKRNVKPAAAKLERHLRTSGIAVKDAPHARVAQDRLKAIAVRLAVMGRSSSRASESCASRYFA